MCLKSICKIILILLFLSPVNILSKDNYLYFDHLSTANGLSHDDVFCILQDKQGFMWFGTSDGLNKYDGYHFTVYNKDSTSSPNLTDNHILSMCEDKQGRLWIGTWDGLNVFDVRKNRISHLMNIPDNPNSLAGNWINRIYQDSQGNIWIGTKDNGLSYIDHSLLVFENPDSNLAFINYTYNPTDSTSLAVNNINTICEDSSGYIWIGTQGAGLNKFDPERNSFQRFPYLKYEGIFDPIIRKIWREPGIKNNKLWIATQHTLNEVNATNGQIITHAYDRLVHEGFLGINKIDERTFWLCSQGKGLYVFNKTEGSLNRIESRECNPGRLQHNWIEDIYKDSCGRIWVATLGGGVYKYDRYAHKFPHFQIVVDSPVGRNICVINHLIEDQNSDSSLIWLATPENGLVKFNRETGKAISIAGQGTKIRYNHILQDPELPQIFYTATWGGALIKTDCKTGEVKRLYFHSDFNKLDPNALDEFYNNELSRQVIKDSKGNLWLAAIGGLFKINPKTNHFIVYLPDENNPSSISGRNVTTILEDQSGKIWIGTFENGLNCLDPETELFSHYKHDPQNERSLDQNYIGTLFEDKSGAFWVGTGKMLHRFNQEQNCFERYQEFPGPIMGILEDNQGNFWISTSKGLSKFNPVLKTVRNYEKNDGLQDNRFTIRSAYKSQQGEFFFGGPKGFNAFYPDEIFENPYAPPVVLTDFQIFNQSVKPDNNSPLATIISHTKEISLKHNQSVFSFEFAALNYSAPLKNKFAYQMEGVDPEWVYTDSKRRFATYTQLSPGQYIFKVKASNNDGVWNEEGTSINVIILPAWWQTWWFRTVIFIVLITLIYAIYRFRLNKIIQMERLRVQIASDLHDDIGASLTRIAVHSEIIKSARDNKSIRQSSGRIGTMSREIISTLSDVVWSIDARNDSVGDLLDRMRDFLDTVLPPGSIKIDFRTQGLHFDQKLPQELRQNIYLIFKEAVNNAARHSGGTEIRISLTNGSGAFFMQIADNGSGFTVQKSSAGHHGLDNMRMRAERIGGKLEIETNQGTHITLKTRSI